MICKGMIWISALLVLFCAYSVWAASVDNDIMTVSANILNSTGPSTFSGIRIQVPDYLFLGNLSSNGKSDEVKIYVNNTGNVNVTVTPQLVDPEDEIFSNLYFRETKTKDGKSVPFTRIGDFHFTILAPTGSATYKSKYFYMQLDLSNAGTDVPSDLIDYESDIKFFAAAA